MIGIEPLDSLCNEADQKLQEVIQWGKEMGAKYNVAPILPIILLEGLIGNLK